MSEMLGAGIDLATGETWISPLPQEEISEIEAMVADAIIRESEETSARVNAETIRARLQQGIITADQHITNLSGTPTNAQVVAATLFVVRAVKNLAKLELKDLESSD